VIERVGLTRRHFLALSIAFVAPLLPAIVRPRPMTGGAPGPDAAAVLADVSAVPASARRVGRAYLAATPAEANVARLAAGVVGSLPAGPALLAGGDADAVRAALANVICDDFRSERTVAVEGWILSRTEARLYAIAALA
jgi:hypothetical protein